MTGERNKQHIGGYKNVSDDQLARCNPSLEALSQFKTHFGLALALRLNTFQQLIIFNIPSSGSGAVAQLVERPLKVPVWCNSTDVGSKHAAALE